MDQKLGVVKGKISDESVRFEDIGKPPPENIQKAAEILTELRRVNRSIAFSDWTTAIVVIGGFVLPLAIVLWRWALS
jgi:hypothetical protein